MCIGGMARQGLLVIGRNTMISLVGWQGTSDWNSSRSEKPNMANIKDLPLLGNALRANPTYELSLRDFSHTPIPLGEGHSGGWV